jgi:hypothetical protein
MKGVYYSGERFIVIIVDVVCFLQRFDKVEFKVFIDELRDGLVCRDSTQTSASHG